MGTNYSINENGEKIIMGDIVAINLRKEKPSYCTIKQIFLKMTIRI